MGNFDNKESLNVAKSNLNDFFDDLEGKLSLIAGDLDYTSFGLTLQEIRRPMLVVGLPGIGKTCGILSVINKLNSGLPADRKLGFKKILLGQTVVGSMSGIPISMPDGRVVRVQMPDLPNPEVDGEYGVLFLDEITTADEMQIQPALGLADDSRNIGEYTLPEHWVVVAAGNGPDCTNFVRLDDMTISRFVVYDINFNYKKDWRPWAHANHINEDIIAFLNFNSSLCVRVESDDMSEAGKLFPCPRTWERLSTELKMRELMKKPVSQSEILNFAGRIIGVKAAREFSAFLDFKKTLDFDPERIWQGTENDPGLLSKEHFHIILQGCIKKMSSELDANDDGNGNYPIECYKGVANTLKWFLKMVELENKINMIVELKEDLPRVSYMLFEEDFMELCPEFDQFIEDNAELINNNSQDIMNYGF